MIRGKKKFNLALGLGANIFHCVMIAGESMPILLIYFLYGDGVGQGFREGFIFFLKSRGTRNKDTNMYIFRVLSKEILERSRPCACSISVLHDLPIFQQVLLYHWRIPSQRLHFSWYRKRTVKVHVCDYSVLRGLQKFFFYEQNEMIHISLENNLKLWMEISSGGI